MPSKIEWTGETWNPVAGCTPASPGCAHCYAERLAQRLAGRCGYPEDKPFAVTMHPDRLHKPLVWRKPRTILACSMGDLFHEDVPFDYLDRVFAVMALCPQHTFQVLTKRPARMLEYIHADRRMMMAVSHLDKFSITHVAEKLVSWPLPNVWLGTTCEDQPRADERIPLLLQCPAVVRFVSVEPMLGPVDMGRYFSKCYWCEECGERQSYSEPILYRCISCGFEADSKSWGEADHPICPECLESNEDIVCRSCGAGDLKFDFPAKEYPVGLDWVICGGETGPGARPMHPDWVRSLRDQCRKADVPFFMKKMSGGCQPPEDLKIREFPNANA